MCFAETQSMRMQSKFRTASEEGAILNCRTTSLMPPKDSSKSSLSTRLGSGSKASAEQPQLKSLGPKD